MKLSENYCGRVKSQDLCPSAAPSCSLPLQAIALIPVDVSWGKPQSRRGSDSGGDPPLTLKIWSCIAGS